MVKSVIDGFCASFVLCVLGCFFDSELESFAGSGNKCKQMQADARKRKILQKSASKCEKEDKRSR
jgi:hypothetical protein